MNPSSPSNSAYLLLGTSILGLDAKERVQMKEVESDASSEIKARDTIMLDAEVL